MIDLLQRQLALCDTLAMIREAELSSAGSILSGMLAELSVPAEGPEVSAVWHGFTRFAIVRVRPRAPERLDDALGDLLLFEWGVFKWPLPNPQELFLVDLVRQFSVTAERGEYDRMEQVHCTMSFEPTTELRQIGNGTLWSDGDREQWFAQVERSHCFTAVSTRKASAVHVEHEQL